MISSPSEIECQEEMTLCLKDKELIEEIKKNDPSFDYEEWKDDVQNVEKFIEKMDSPLTDIYNIVKSNGLVLRYGDDYLKVVGSPEEIEESKDAIVNAITALGYKIGDISFVSDDMHITIEKCMSLVEDIVSYWAFMDDGTDRTRSYVSTVNASKDIGFDSLPHILSSIDIPTTLSDYLHYSVERKRKEGRIMKLKGYSLYELLKDKDWTLTPPCSNEDKYEFVLNDMSSEEVAEIEDGLVSWLGKDNVQECDSATFFINSPDISELIQIDTFYHPRIIPISLFDEIF